MTTNTTTKTPDISVTVDAAQGLLNLTCKTGETINLHVSELTPEIRAQALLHGLKQKLVDAAAISRDPETGRTAGIDVKFQAVVEVYNRLISGQWNKTREGGNGGGNMGLLLAALIRLYDGVKTEEQLREYVAGLDEKQQAAVRATAKVAPIIAAIKAERDAKRANAINGDDLLAGLDDVA